MGLPESPAPAARDARDGATPEERMKEGGTSVPEPERQR